MDKPVRLGLIGYGWFAELLSESTFPLVPEIKVTAICDPNPDRRRLGTQLLDVAAYEDVDALLSASDCEAVAILTPHNTHRAITERAARAGRHIFCEKAMAVTVEDCLAMISAAQRADVTLMVGHKRRLRPSYARMAQLVHSRQYGEPLAINVFGHHWAPVFEGWWRSKEACGGLLYWAGVHDIDTIRFVLQDEVRDVHAVVGPKTDQYTEYEDSIALTLRFERGAIATLQVAPHDPLRDFYESFGFAVLCEGGGIRYNPEIPAVEYASRSGLQPGDRTVEPFPNRRQDLDSAYHREFTNFAQVVRGTQPPLLTAEDGLRTVEIMQAAYQSVTTGSTVRLQRATLDHER